MMARVDNRAKSWKPVGTVDYNLVGQRLGRKGQETRERIVAATMSIIESSPDSTLTLSAVARVVSVSMTNLYLYFPDLGDLVLACLSRVMDTADAAYMKWLRVRWPDDGLELCALEFLRAHYQFYRKHARILQIRNGYADAGDPRFVAYRQRVVRPFMEYLVEQMDGKEQGLNSHYADTAVVIMTGIERVATVQTNSAFRVVAESAGILDQAAYAERLMAASAEFMAVTIRHKRAAAGAERGGTSMM